MKSTRRPALLFAVVLLAGCAGMPTSGGGETAAMAEALFREGDLRGAAEAFVDAARESRRDRDRLLLRAAEVWREEGDLGQARTVLGDVDQRRLSGGEVVRFNLLWSELALEAGDLATAQRLLASEPTGMSLAQRARFHELRGRAWESNDPFVAAREYARLDALLEGQERRENSRRIRTLLGAVGDQPLRRAAATLAAGDPLRPFAARALSSRGVSLPDSLRDEGVRRADRFAAPTAGARVALLLPLSGPLRAAAVPVRDGFLAARFAAGDGAPDIMLIDAGESPESAVAGYRQAVEAGAYQVVGPLSRNAVALLFAERDLPVPVLALNRSPGALPPGHLSFALSPEDEAMAAARLLAQRGLVRVVTVGGRDELAQRTLEAFRSRHLQAGGEVLADITLPPSGVDFKREISSALAGAGLPTSAPVDLSIPHNPGFDAVFLAVRPEQARLLVPQLKLAGLLGLPMIGTSMLHAVDDASRQDRELDGIEFTELPWVIEDRPGLPSRASLRPHLDSSGAAAARLFAFGLDAWRLLVDQDSLGGASLPLAGATGELSIDAFGDARSQPVIARFRGGQARYLESGNLRPE